ncbi:MAG: hypothetical protein KAH77_03775 [Thiomargarita sp.]|nr:hypothetical protein [Thiomargarita sp.]
MSFKINILIIGIFFLNGCGFHLRGSEGDISLSFQTVYVQSENADKLALEVKRIFIEKGIEVLPNAQTAQVVLYFRNEQSKRRVLSVSSASGKLEEVELSYHVDIEARTPDDTILLEKRPIHLIRDHRYDELTILATGAEEEILRKDMFRDVLAQVMRRIQSIRINDESS